MNTALAKQGKIVGDYVARTDQAEKDSSSHTTAMEKGIASVEGDLAELRSLPASLKDLQSAAHRIDETTTSFDGRFGEIHARVAALDAKLDALLARPLCTPPVPSAPPKGSAPVALAASGRAEPSSPVPLNPDGGRTLP